MIAQFRNNETSEIEFTLPQGKLPFNRFAEEIDKLSKQYPRDKYFLIYDHNTPNNNKEETTMAKKNRLYDFQVMNGEYVIIGTIKGENATLAKEAAIKEFNDIGAQVKRVTAEEAQNIQAAFDMKAKFSAEKAEPEEEFAEMELDETAENPTHKPEPIPARKTNPIKTKTKAQKTGTIDIDFSRAKPAPTEAKEAKTRKRNFWVSSEMEPGTFPTPKFPKPDVNKAQLDAYKELRNLFLTADKGVKKETEISKEFTDGILMVYYSTKRKDGTVVTRTTGIYPGGRPVAWGQRPGGAPYIFRGTKDVVKFGYSVK